MRSLFSFLLFMGILPAADVSISQSDFIERFVNFAIFVSILWYLGAERIKNIFLQRTQRISARFESVQEEEKVLKRQLQEAERILADAKVKSAEILANARKEAFLITQQFDTRLEQDIKMLSQSFDEALKQEKKEIVKNEVFYAMDCVAQTLNISEDSYMKVLTKGLSNA